MLTPFDTGRSLTAKTEYDALGNVKREISPRAWDAAGGGPSFTDFVSSHSYDALGRLVKTTLPKAASETQDYVHSAYDGNGPPELGEPADDGRQRRRAVTAAEKTVNEYWDSSSKPLKLVAIVYASPAMLCASAALVRLPFASSG